MNKESAVTQLLKGYTKEPQHSEGSFFAATNIALAKYWGKRNVELNLPITSSLSISLGALGTETSIYLQASNATEDVILMNKKRVDNDSPFALRLIKFLDLFRFVPARYFRVETSANIPIAAGVASSASGFAAVVGALDQLYDWKLPKATLSRLARLGSGSAARSFWPGFVEWQAGSEEDGMDSYGIPIAETWPALRIGLLLLDTDPKPLSSTQAMQKTVLTSSFYELWPTKQMADLARLKAAIATHAFTELGEVAEANALAMHALMLTASPPILYSSPKTVEMIHKIWYYREKGLNIYFTQDAGPNLKLLFLKEDEEVISKLFPTLVIIAPFGANKAVL